MPSSNQVPIDQLEIHIDGVKLDKDIHTHVSNVTIESALHVPDMAVITFSQLELPTIDGSTFKLGAALKVKMSDKDGQLSVVFDGEIVALEPVFENNLTGLIVRGYDKIHRLHRGTKTKVFKNVTDSDIASQIASGAGLTPNVDSTTETFEQIIQYVQSDFDFLIERARRIGYEVRTDGNKLKFVKPTSPSSSDQTLEFRKELISFRPRMTLSAQVDTVTVRGWDVKKKDAISSSASSSDVQAQVAAGQSGGAAAQSALSAGATYTIVNTPVATTEDAQSVAQGLLNQVNSRFIQADGEAIGLPALRAGMVVDVKNVGSTYSGKYRLTTVRHQYMQGDYRVFFTVAGPRPELISYLVSDEGPSQIRSKWGGVYSALVTDNKSPTDYAMVKLKFPWLDDTVVSNWARIITPGGGAARGIYFMPEVNDEVLVAFEHGDFDYPYVIGGLYNGSDAPPIAADGDVVAEGKVKTRVIKTRTGHTITFVDDSNGEEYIEIKDAKGNNSMKFDTANKKLTITSTGDIEITADGNITMTSKKDISIKASSGNVSIEGMTFAAKGTNSADIKSDSGGASLQGMTINVKGQTSGDVSAVALNVKADADLILKGAMVMIN